MIVSILSLTVKELKNIENFCNRKKRKYKIGNLISKMTWLLYYNNLLKPILIKVIK